jgi:PiT family inorganic phosphate transporter
MGVGSAKRLSAVRWGVVKEIVAAWFLTFPVCAFIGWIIALLFSRIF